MFGRAIWGKLPECIFENIEIARELSEPNMWLLVNHTKPTNTLHWNYYILTAGIYKSASKQLQNSGRLQSNTINGVMSVAINRVINKWIN